MPIALASQHWAATPLITVSLALESGGCPSGSFVLNETKSPYTAQAIVLTDVASHRCRRDKMSNQKQFPHRSSGCLVVVLPPLTIPVRAGFGGCKSGKWRTFRIFDAFALPWTLALTGRNGMVPLTNLSRAFRPLCSPQQEDRLAGGGVHWVAQHREGSLEEARSVRC